MKYIPAVVFHLLPLLPFVLGYPYYGIALVLLVVVAYSKVHKLRLLEKEQMTKNVKVDPSIRKAIRFWERLTFLKGSADPE